jgi:putative DNA primase/helicase
MSGGAASVRIVDIPKDWPDGWDLADPLPDGVGMEILYELLRSAALWVPPAYVSFGAYRMNARGLFWVSDGRPM